MANNKNLYFQILRGMCIIAVILIHSSSVLNEWPIHLTFIRQFIDFPVAIFFFISGYVIKSNTQNFVLKRLKRIVIPYLFW